MYFLKKHWDYSVYTPQQCRQCSSVDYSTFPTDTAKRWPLSMNHSNCLAHKEAGKDSSFKYLSNHHPRREGLRFLYRLKSEPTWFYQGATCKFPFVKRQVLATLHLKRVRKREVSYHWSCSRFNHMMKWDLCSVNMPLTTRQDHGRSWKHKMEVYQTHLGLS